MNQLYHGYIKMGQTKYQTLIEVSTNVIIGAIIAWFITYIIIINVRDPKIASMLSVSLCTLASFIRGYFVRRYFNKTMDSKL